MRITKKIFQEKLKRLTYTIEEIYDDSKKYKAIVIGEYMAIKSKMSIEDLANIIIPRLDKIENTLEEHSEKFILIEKTLQEHSEILEKHSEILNKHSEILSRNNLE